ncbi:hypothetical protein [Salinicola peritrichatus]|uniref:hypothetical protein n=1 Tax=Salinicola peritrichatus TaxID=1267424 RepID=UPI000DA245FB|nr:hypothetical protein [Salinicola peritrichatus]
MKKDTLYLHVGWSKTGTSAIQAQIQAQRESFLAQGILYPQSLQWPDHSHHPFALAFRNAGVYASDMAPAQAIEKLQQEIDASSAESVLISSELSPFYFDNPRFRQLAAEYFQRVKVIFTLRCQSELLLSLFNQLVKDPNVRYPSSLFALAMNNINWLNYNQNVKRWTDVVGQENIVIVPYGRDVVDRFLMLFGVVYKQAEAGQSTIVNPSVPTRCLSMIQEQGRHAGDNDSFLAIRDRIITASKYVANDNDKYELFSVPEQQSFDQYFKRSNQSLATQFEFDVSLLEKSNYKPVLVLPPNFNLEACQVA